MESSNPTVDLSQMLSRLQNVFARGLGVDSERKGYIYIELTQAATLADLGYWLQILFACGIATLGLVLNSPAVIIGAMLISPLMGPILAQGLSLTTGDFILGLRALVNLLLSCAAAILFSASLVWILPFKELTGEIAARTHPNTLDLFVALFSGIIGTVATAKEAKGVVTSIPGVSIAVALMPPLCVVGYGLGLALSLDFSGGMRVAGGGGLLFLTNLIAITFSAMVVFWLLRIDTEEAKERVREWTRADLESRFVFRFLGRLHVPDAARKIGGFPGRFLAPLFLILLILIPLNKSFFQLLEEINHQRRENEIRQAAVKLWEENLAKPGGGEPRSHLDRLTVSESDGLLILSFQVITDIPYTPDERNAFSGKLANRIGLPPEALQVRFIQIPTTLGLTAIRTKSVEVETPPRVTELQARFVERVDAALRGLRFPASTVFLGYQVTTGIGDPLLIRTSYLGDHDLDADAQSLIVGDIRTRLDQAQTQVVFTRIPSLLGPVAFARREAALPDGGDGVLELVGSTLQRYAHLRAEIAANIERGEAEDLRAARAEAVKTYLTTIWKIPPERLAVSDGAEVERTVRIALSVGPNWTN